MPLIFLLSVSLSLSGQKNNDRNIKKIQITAFDTNVIYKYNSKLVVGPCLSYRNYNIIIRPKKRIDSLEYIPSIKWRSPSNRFWGLDFNYDKFGFTLSLASTEPKSEKEKKGESSSSSFGFSYGGNRCFIEASFRTFKGFYDRNSFIEDTTRTSYYQSENLSSTMLNVKLFYFTNHHKFAFKSCYGGLYRQLKTRGSWVFSSNLHMNEILTDSTIVPDPNRNKFGDALKVQSVGCAGISVGIGAAVNFVFFKTYFINLSYVGGPDFQTLSATTNDASNGLVKQYASYADDFRFATGLNRKYWYLTFTVCNENTRFNHDIISIRGRTNSYSLNFGYRFSVKKPVLYGKFQNTWFYNMF